MQFERRTVASAQARHLRPDKVMIPIRARDGEWAIGRAIAGIRYRAAVHRGEED